MDEPARSNTSTRGLWWLYPSSENDESFINWVIECAWIWVAASVVVVGSVDTAYYEGAGRLPLMLSMGLFLVLVLTCGRGPCYWVHRDIPWAILIGSILVMVDIILRI